MDEVEFATKVLDAGFMALRQAGVIPKDVFWVFSEGALTPNPLRDGSLTYYVREINQLTTNLTVTLTRVAVPWHQRALAWRPWDPATPFTVRGVYSNLRPLLSNLPGRPEILAQATVAVAAGKDYTFAALQAAKAMVGEGGVSALARTAVGTFEQLILRNLMLIVVDPSLFDEPEPGPHGYDS